MANKGSRFFDAILAFNSFCKLNRISPEKLRIQFVPQSQEAKSQLQIALINEFSPLVEPLTLSSVSQFQFLGFNIEVLGPTLDDCTDYGTSG